MAKKSMLEGLLDEKNQKKQVSKPKAPTPAQWHKEGMTSPEEEIYNVPAPKYIPGSNIATYKAPDTSNPVNPAPAYTPPVSPPKSNPVITSPLWQQAQKALEEQRSSNSIVPETSNSIVEPVQSTTPAVTGVDPTPTSAPTPEPDPGPSIQDLINQLIEQQRQQQIAALQAAQERALTGLESSYTQRQAALETAKNNYIANLENALASSMGHLDSESAKVQPYYYDKRNQAAAQSDVGALNFAQYMAGRGIKGSAGAMPEIYRNAALQGNIGALNQAEAANLAEIERHRSQIQDAYATNQANVLSNYERDLLGLTNEYNINKQGILSAYEQDRLAALAGLDAQGLQAYIDQLNADRMFGLNEAQITGTYGGTPTLQAQQFEFDKAVQEAGLTGLYNNQPTFQREQWQADIEYRNKTFDENVRQFEKTYGLDLKRLNLQQASQAIDAAYKRGQLSLAQARQALDEAEFIERQKQNQWEREQTELKQNQPADISGYTQSAINMRMQGATNSDIIAYIGSLPVSAQQKADIANALGL